MTVTETRPDSEAMTPPPPPPVVEPAGPYGLLTTADHKRIGRLYVGFSLLFLLAALTVRVLVLAERIDLTDGFGGVFDDSFAQAASFELVAFSFLVLIPMWLGIAHVVVPLQIGARTMAFPRAAAAALWTWIVASGVMIGAYLMNGGPFGGDAEGVDLFIVAFAAVAGALLIGSICIVTTAFTLRAPGMRLARAPYFTWSIIVAGTIWVLSLGALIAGLAIAYVDHRYGNRQLLGGNFGLLDSFDWVFRQPQIYAVALPALGFIADAVPVAARHRPSAPGAVRAVIGLAGLLAFGAFSALPFFGDELTSDDVFITLALLGGIPALALVLLLGDALSRGTPKVTGPLVAALLSGLLLAVAGIAGAVTVIEPLDLNEGQWFIGHNYLVTGAALVAGLGALHYWAPKILGHLVVEAAGRLAPLIIVAGVAVMGGAQLGSGFLDQPDEFDLTGRGETAVQTISYGLGDVTTDTDAAETLNGIALAGAGITALGVLAYLGAVAASARGGRPANDPWGGHTLEWATASPPEPGNFDGPVPHVRSDAPLLVDSDQSADQNQGAE